MSLSSEIYLLTQTTAKDQNKGGGKTTTAEAEVKATIKYCTGCIEEPAEDICETEDGNAVNDGPTVYEASPKGGVVMASRTQELSVDVDLNCGDLCTITGYVEVGLKLETKAAQSFTWVAELRDTTGTGSNSDPIRSVACFNWDSSAEIPDVSSSAVGIQDTVFIVTEAQPSKLREALP